MDYQWQVASSIAVISHEYMFFSNLIITNCYHLNILILTEVGIETYPMGYLYFFSYKIHSMSNKHYLNLQYLSMLTPCAGYALLWFCVCKLNITIKSYIKKLSLICQRHFLISFNIQLKAIR